MSPTSAIATVCFYEGELRKTLGQSASAFRWYRRGLRALESLDSATVDRLLLVRLLAGCGSVRVVQARHDEAVDWHNRALEEAERSGDSLAIASACDMLQCLYQEVRDRRGRAFGERAVRLFEECGATYFLSTALNNLANNRYVFGDWAAALALYEASLAALESMEDDVHIAVVTNNIADVLANQGHFDDARTRYEEALAIAEASRSVYGAFFRTNLARVVSMTGDGAHATSLFDEARRGLEAIGIPAYVHQVDVRRAENFARGGQPAAALSCLPADGDILDSDRPSLLRVRASIEFQLGRFESSRRLAQAAIEASRAAENPYETAVGLDVLAVVLAQLGEESAAIVAERDEIFDRLGVIATRGVLPAANLVRA
jgi:tetratricopeptide (TPR) repeat protein